MFYHDVSATANLVSVVQHTRAASTCSKARPPEDRNSEARGNLIKLKIAINATIRALICLLIFSRRHTLL